MSISCFRETGPGKYTLPPIGRIFLVASSRAIEFEKRTKQDQTHFSTYKRNLLNHQNILVGLIDCGQIECFRVGNLLFPDCSWRVRYPVPESA